MLITLLQLLYSIFRHNGKRWKNIDHGVMISQRFYDLLNNFVRSDKQNAHSQSEIKKVRCMNYWLPDSSLF